MRSKALRGAGILALYKGEFRRAEDRLKESEGICRGLGDKSGLAQALYFRGVLARHHGRFEEEKALFIESTALFVSLGDSSWIARFSGNLEYRVEYYRKIGDRSNLAKTLNNLGDKIRLQGDLGRARELYEEGLSLYRELHDPGGIAWSLMNLGETRRAQGEEREAWALFRESLVLWLEVGNQRGIADALAGMARSTIGEQPERAAQWLGAGEAALDELEVPRMDDRPGYGQDVARLQETLGETRFEALWRQGRETGIDRIASKARPEP
ncbi:MAG: tetratricopeptide repeat protein [Armatimonadetes bacterium]|nr:tetratricopeptide repeat protein [Armatimonadota bacterium]